jgi:[ribosomal protein S5]-alanine N-acetyltransferase
MFDAPSAIETERLRLRLPTERDSGAIFDYARDPEVTRFTNWPSHSSISVTQAFLHGCLANIAIGEELSWVLTAPPDDTGIGMVSVRVRGHSVDFGYALNRRFWNVGFGTEAARAVVAWAFGLESTYRVWATCDVDNRASARVLEKVGLTREGLLRCSEVRPNLCPEPRDAYVYAKVRHAA